ncbi:hypothetical protein C4E44_28090 [Pseudomonas sp. MWU12-2312b]|uniref:transporter n=1 Tax=Pseudomonas moorei TaxID=395599 RepID=UPI000D4ECA1C|nr:transporter [Pseudomonas moorei]PPA00779.1 hypothetical protein C4E44_28090 [Pseudomonas sp. MWU12-2312b]
MFAETLRLRSVFCWSKIPVIALSLSLLFVLCMPRAHALGFDMGDLTAPAPGQDLIALYAINNKNSSMYKNGRVIDSRANLNATTSVFRYTHAVEVGGSTIVMPQVAIFHNNLSPDNVAGLENTSGMSDLLVGAPFWLYVNRDAREYFVVCPYVFLPVGEYDHNDYLNPGENRWKGVFQVGYQRSLSEHVDMEMMVETTAYGKNDEYGPDKLTLRQRPLYELRGIVSYRFDDSGSSRVGAGMYQQYGGETTVDGASQGDMTNTQGFLVEASTMLGRSDQLLFSFSRDLEVENGFKTSHQFKIRYLHLF